MHESIYDEFVAKLAAKARTIRIGNPVDPSVQLGPVVSKRQQERVLRYVAGVAEDGAAV